MELVVSAGFNRHLAPSFKEFLELLENGGKGIGGISVGKANPVLFPSEKDVFVVSVLHGRVSSVSDSRGVVN